MNKVRNILESDIGAKLVIRWGYDKLVARLDVGKLHYRGEGITVNEAVNALNGDIKMLRSPTGSVGYGLHAKKWRRWLGLNEEYLQILSQETTLSECLLAWANDKLEAISWYDASLARKLSLHGLATPAERNALAQLRVKYPDQPLLDELEKSAESVKVRCVKTSGGNLTLEGDIITGAYCYSCNCSGSPFVINGKVKCSCGNVVAEKEEIKEVQNG